MRQFWSHKLNATLNMAEISLAAELQHTGEKHIIHLSVQVPTS